MNEKLALKEKKASKKITVEAIGINLTSEARLVATAVLWVKRN